MSSAAPGSRARVLTALTAAHTINDFYGLILPPLLPALREAFGLSYAQLGLVPFVSTLVSALLQPTLGYVADRRRLRRALMVVGFVGFALGMLALSSAQGYAGVLLAAAVLGLAQSTYHPQSATFLVHYFRENRGFAQGIHGLGNGLGFMLAPLVVAPLTLQLGWQGAVRTLALPALLAVAIVLIFLREPLAQGGAGMFAGVTRPLLLLMWVNGLSLLVGTGFMVWLPSYYAAQGYNLAEAGALTAVMAAAGLVAQPAGGALSDRFGRRAIVIGSLIGMGVFQLLFVTTTWLPLMLAFSLVVGFCMSLMPPVAMVYASELAAGQRTGTAVGVVWGLGTAIASLSPPLSGLAIDALGFATAYAALALVAFGAVALAARLPR